MEVSESDEIAAYSLCKRAYGLPCPPCKHSVELTEQISSAQNDVDYTNSISKLTQLRTVINSNHEPFIHRLPPEISTNILEMTLSKEWYTVEQQHQLSKAEQGWPLVLGAVCKTWRRLAWSSPRLWATIHLVYDVTAATLLTPTRLNVAKEWLRRSGHRPLSISIYARQDRLSDFPETAETVTHSLMPFVDLINNYSHRWQWLDIQVTGSNLTFLEGNGKGPVILDRLRIIEDDMTPAILFHLKGTEPSPTLLSSTFSIVQSVDRTNLVIVQLSQLSHGDILELFECATRLESCEVGDVDFDPVSYDPSCPRFAHEKLKSLKVDCMDPDANAPLFTKLFLPALHHLRFDRYFVRFDFTSLIDIALHSDTWPLTSLCLDCRFENDGGLVTFLQHSVLLEEVEIHTEREWQSMDEISTLLRHLAAITITPEGYRQTPNPEIFLPKLTCLKIVTNSPGPDEQEATFLWGLCADIFEPITNISAKASFRRPIFSLSVEHHDAQQDLPDPPISTVSFISELDTRRFEEISKAGVSLRLRSIGERGDFDIFELSKWHHAGSSPV